MEGTLSPVVETPEKLFVFTSSPQNMGLWAVDKGHHPSAMQLGPWLRSTRCVLAAMARRATRVGLVFVPE